MIAPPEAQATIIDVTTYTADEFTEHKDVGVDTVRTARAGSGVTWVNLTGLGDTDVIQEVANVFGLHQLALEDVLNLHQRSKVEEFEGHLFIALRMIVRAGTSATEQVSMFLGDNFVLSIQEQTSDCFDPVRARLSNGKSPLRSRGADYLAYTLIDAIVDGYFPVLERLGEELEYLEDTIVRDPHPEAVGDLHDLKRHFLALRRAVWPYRELLSTLTREEHTLLQRETRLYLRDCYDHAVQLIDLLETYRETASALMDVYMSSTSARLNEVMKVLTIIATLFMPLGFIAGVYGMNFDRAASAWNMPELGWQFGYPLALGLMGACVVGLLFFFWRKGWLGDRNRNRRRDREQH